MGVLVGGLGSWGRASAQQVGGVLTAALSSGSAGTQDKCLGVSTSERSRSQGQYAQFRCELHPKRMIFLNPLPPVKSQVDFEPCIRCPEHGLEHCCNSHNSSLVFNKLLKRYGTSVE